jgi:hypothetical protein
MLIPAAQVPPSQGFSVEVNAFDLAVILAVFADVFVHHDLFVMQLFSETGLPRKAGIRHFEANAECAGEVTEF